MDGQHHVLQQQAGSEAIAQPRRRLDVDGSGASGQKRMVMTRDGHGPPDRRRHRGRKRSRRRSLSALGQHVSLIPHGGVRKDGRPAARLVAIARNQLRKEEERLDGADDEDVADGGAVDAQAVSVGGQQQNNVALAQSPLCLGHALLLLARRKPSMKVQDDKVCASGRVDCRR